MRSCASERFNNCTLKGHVMLNSCVVHYYPRFYNINPSVFFKIVALLIVVQLLSCHLYCVFIEIYLYIHKLFYFRQRKYYIWLLQLR